MVEAKTTRKRVTNRRTYESEARRPTITFRVREELHAGLKSSAEARGYSLSEEIEHRLNKSMEKAPDAVIEHALQCIADNFRAIQNIAGRGMLTDRFVLQACCEAAYRVVEMFGGINGISLDTGLLAGLGPDGMEIEAGKQLGLSIVWHRELRAMKDAPAEATAAYEAGVVDALTRRIAALQARAAMAPAAPPEVEPAEPAQPVGKADPSRPAQRRLHLGEQPAARPATPADGAFTAQDDPKRPGSLFDDHDNAGLGLELVGGPADDAPPEPAPSPKRGGNDVGKIVQAAKPRRRAKAPA